jgi:hypothetical protein
MLTVVAPSTAQDLSWSSGISITEMTPQSGIFSHIDVVRVKQGVIGSWFSTANILPVLVKSPCLNYEAYGDFPGITKIEKVVLSPDDGATEWPACQIVGKGWKVGVPFATQTVYRQVTEKVKVHGKKTTVTRNVAYTVAGLEPGGYGWKWGVYSRDKKNRLVLWIIPISYTTTRVSSAANHIMVQQAPAGFESFTDQMMFAHLRGFVPVWATPDPAFIALQNVQATMPGMPKVSAPQPVAPAVQPVAQTQSVPQPDGAVNQPSLVCVNIHIWKGNGYQRWRDQMVVLSDYHVGQIIEFSRGGKVVSVVEVTKVESGLELIEMRVLAGDWPTADCAYDVSAEGK